MERSVYKERGGGGVQACRADTRFGPFFVLRSLFLA